MSIWCSWEHIGTDPNQWHDATSGEPIERRAERGVVLSYANGWSNHYPDLTGRAERPAAVAIAHVAPWCVPGRDCDEVDEPDCGPWLRLEVAAPETLNFWRKDDDGSPEVECEGATVVMDEAAVKALRDDLTKWLNQEKVHPR